MYTWKFLINLKANKLFMSEAFIFYLLFNVALMLSLGVFYYCYLCFNFTLCIKKMYHSSGDQTLEHVLSPF